MATRLRPLGHKGRPHFQTDRTTHTARCNEVPPLPHCFIALTVVSCSDRPVSVTSGYPTMEGKVALVTGSTSGIGLGIARCLANRGCNVIITGFGEQDLVDQIVTELSRCVYLQTTGFD